MQEQFSVNHAVLLRVCCGSRRLGFFCFRKLACLHSPKPWHESSDSLYLLEIKYTPTKSHMQMTGAHGSVGPAHTTAAAFFY